MRQLKISVFVIVFLLALVLIVGAEDETLLMAIDKKLDLLLSGKCPEVECPEVDDKKCLVEFIYTMNDLPDTASLTVYRVYTLPDGKKFLIPTWAIEPTPQPPVDPPVPEWEATADNAIDKCANCHKETESKFKYAGWKDDMHDKHKNHPCTACHLK